jgi:hypothetical protein
MTLRADQELQTTLSELRSAEAELDELKRQLRLFEAQVDNRLGSLLDELSDLNVETSTLDGKLRRIREERLFGSDLMQYLDGAPQPARPLNLADLPPPELAQRNAVQEKAIRPPATGDQPVPDMKVLYRRLARRYHPDLARNDADRAQSNDQMKEINRAYSAGDLPTLMRLAGLEPSYGIPLGSTQNKMDAFPKPPLTELEVAQRKLREVRQQINRLGTLPMVKLSLDMKLARHQGRDLLGEMTAELRYKVARKLAERDYLRSQIAANEA